jgi:deazaflavin-dependent oxidoreductase (nitroreductase family)
VQQLTTRQTNRDDSLHDEEPMTTQAESLSPAGLSTSDNGLIKEFRTTGGAISGRFSGVPLLLLSTTAAKTGQLQTTPLIYSRDFSRLVIIAAEHGSQTLPDWYHDITADPVVTVEVGGEQFQAFARVTEGVERQRLFDQMASERPNLEFLEFPSRTARQIPVIVLERVLDKTTDYNAFNRNLIEEFHARGGKVGGMFEGLPLLLLTTTGAKSGQLRTTPLVYGTDRDRLVIAASKGGSPTNPDWFHNIVSNPEVTVEVGTEAFLARATVATGAGRQRLFDLLVDVTPQLAETQRSTSREIPIIVLERGSR